jgi:NADPH:quinone reductase-like Zn-dependent oxidoreductase
MRVIECDEYGGPEVLHLAERPIPAPPPGTIRLRVHAAAVNPADPKLRSGMFHAVAPFVFPQVLGYDVAGVIDELGAGVTGLHTGDRVFAMLNPLTRGAYAQYVVLPAADAVPIPPALDFAAAAAIPTGGLTGVQMIEDYAKPQKGDVVLITGATGSVGRFAMFAARQCGAHIIAAVRASQADEARALGAADTLVLGEQGWTGQDFKFVIDTVGGPAVAALCRHLQPGGAIFTAATAPINPQGLASTPVFVVVHNAPARLRDLAAAVASGSLSLPIGRRLPLADAAAAHRLVESGGTGGKIILEL